MSDSFLKSTFVEQLVEHVFLAELLQEVWYRYKKTVEVLRAEVDASGYDVVLECNGVLRHVQLKTSKPNKNDGQPVNVALASKPSGCVVWILRHEDIDNYRTKLSYRYFGSSPGIPLPNTDSFRLVKRTTKGRGGVKPTRASIRMIPKGKFTAVPDTKALVRCLFGLTYAENSKPENDGGASG
jgi:hypothetical protein